MIDITSSFMTQINNIITYGLPIGFAIFVIFLVYYLVKRPTRPKSTEPSTEEKLFSYLGQAVFGSFGYPTDEQINKLQHSHNGILTKMDKIPAIEEKMNSFALKDQLIKLDTVIKQLQNDIKHINIPNITHLATKEQLQDTLTQFNDTFTDVADAMKDMDKRLTKHEESNKKDMDKLKSIIADIKELG